MFIEESSSQGTSRLCFPPKLGELPVGSVYRRIVTSCVCGRGNVYVVCVCVCLCVSVCVSVWAITFEAFDIETSFLV